jgi:hypothetical protein
LTRNMSSDEYGAVIQELPANQASKTEVAAAI